MRWLRRIREQQRGATAITVLFLLIPILAIGAIAVDVGGLYMEKSQLQNGADAAALAAAADCAKNACANDEEVANRFADRNSLDEDAAIESVTPSGAQVTVDVMSEGIGVRHPFAALLGISPSIVHATATATFGRPTAGSAIAIAIASCQFDLAEPQEGVEAPTKIVVSWHENQHKECPSTNPDGGFGWLNDVDANCRTELDLGPDGVIIKELKPGISTPSGCDLSGVLNKTVLIPIFSSKDKPRTVHITGFAAFTVTGYKISPGNPKSTPTVDQDAPFCLDDKDKVDNSCVFLQGYFQRYVTVEEGWEYGDSGTDYALDAVRLIN